MGFTHTSAVNISAKQFIRSKLDDLIKNILDETKLDPKYLELELTETILMEDIERTVRILNDIKVVGKVELEPQFEGRQMIMIIQPV